MNTKLITNSDKVDRVLGDFKKLPVLKFPFVATRLKDELTDEAYVLSGGTVICQSCQKKIVSDLRGTITEMAQCLETQYGGYCPNCVDVTSYHYRIYPEGNRVLMKTENGTWEEAEYDVSFFARVFDTIKELKVWLINIYRQIE